ncbi:unnamed protein product [Caenorhabditis auriculariae]|uniref:glucuronosyltransferase n=1 Tax=Caenorhabditis auriculariae TaxID=2777116 RepID=A0A8S1H867_9PELO|nr:unnamed protein product [Caenorhabditis auriculariae]
MNLLNLILLTPAIDCYKILVYSNLAGHSHVKFMGAVADLLTDSGHDVTVLMPLMNMKELPKTGLKTTKKVIYVETEDRIKEKAKKGNDKFKDLWTSDIDNPFAQLELLQPMADSYAFQCEKVTNDTKLLGQLKAEKFDLGVAEPFHQCPYALFELIDIPAHVSALSCVYMDHVSVAIGQPQAPSYVPGTQSTFSDKMSFKERFLNLIHILFGNYMYSYVGDSEFDAVRKSHPHIRQWREILAETSFLLTSAIPLLDFPAPTISKIIPVGGLTVNTKKKDVVLSEEWDKVLGKRKRNVLISFGSNIRSESMPLQYREQFVKVFASMPDTTFIWKYEEENATFADHLPNVHLGTWLPQNELLADKRLSLFVTHGGLASTTELAVLGKPAIMIPMFADQSRNAQMLSRHGGVVVLHKSDLGNSETVESAIRRVLNDPSYQKNAERLAEMLKEQPTNPREVALKHIEFAANLIAVVIYQVDCYKILVYSNLFGHSHVKFMGTLADLLTDAGHDVTVLMPMMDMTEKSRTGLKTTKKIIYVETEDRLKNLMKDKSTKFKDLWTMENKNPFSLLTMVQSMADMFTYQCERVVNDTALLEQLKNEKFDLGVAEPFDQCPYALFELIDIPAHVSAISCVAMDHVSVAIGQPQAPSYVPGTQSTFNENMSLFERFLNTLQTMTGAYMFNYVGDSTYDSIRKNYPELRSWREILPETSFLLTNAIPILDFPSPTISKIIPVGGLTVNTLKKDTKLPEKWDKVLGERKRTVLISFGSNIKSQDMPEPYKKELLKVFASMPDTTFIWKYEEEKATFADHLPNVHLGTWLPQNELLADKRLSLFVTHGGLASTTELAVLGKPAIMIPMFADQSRNAQMLSRHGGVVVLHKSDLGNSETVESAIRRVINDPSYQKNAERLAEMLKEQPTNPREVALKHIEFAAKFGKLPTMDPYGRKLSFIQYYLLDIAAIFFSAFSTILFVFYLFFKCLFCRSTRKNKSKQE